METHQWTEKKKVPLIGGSNYEDVEIIWEVRVLDDGYIVTELIEFNVIAHGEIH